MGMEYNGMKVKERQGKGWDGNGNEGKGWNGNRVRVKEREGREWERSGLVCVGAWLLCWPAHVFLNVEFVRM